MYHPLAVVIAVLLVASVTVAPAFEAFADRGDHGSKDRKGKDNKKEKDNEEERDNEEEKDKKAKGGNEKGKKKGPKDKQKILCEEENGKYKYKFKCKEHDDDDHDDEDHDDEDENDGDHDDNHDDE